MAINNTVYEFMRRFDRGDLNTMEGLEDYFSHYPEVFSEYFPDHCQRTDERLIQAIEQYPVKVGDIEQAGQRLPEEIEKVGGIYRSLTGIDPDMDHHLFVGAFGSNAFIGGKTKEVAYYALEMLSPDPDDLCLVAAHEMGHVVHFRMSAKTMGDTWWRRVGWGEPVVTLLSEGGATYLSQLAVPGRERPAYISYGALGEEGYGYYMANKRVIQEEFQKDMHTGWSDEKEKEWFRLSGGSRHGFARLGYYIADDFIRWRAELRGMDNALTDWDRLKLEEEFKDFIKA